MKRALCFLLLLIMIVPVLLLPASAAEEYIFYPYTLPVAFDSTELTPETSGDFAGWFSGDFIVSDGRYSLSIISSDGNSFVSAAPFDINFESPGTDGADRSFKGYANFDLTFFDGSYFSGVPCYIRVLEFDGTTLCTVGPDSAADSEVKTLWRGTTLSLFTLTLSAVTPMDSVMNTFSVLCDCVNRSFDIVIKNPYLSAFAAAGLIILCIPIYVQLKKATH